jgi:hypothetical protein
MTPQDQLAEAIRIHDDDPWKARELLLPLVDALREPAELARLTWLGTHVLGGLLRRWPEAQSLCGRAAATAGAPRADMLSRLAVTATLAGDATEAAAAEERLAALLGASAADCAAFIRLAIVEQDLAEDRIAAALPPLDRAAAAAESIETPPELVRLVAITANNSASLLLEWVPAATGETARVMERTARLSFRCWHAVGTWVHQERAHYLMALVSNATGQWVRGAEHARAGLALIAANEPQPIDRCFHLLTLARALKATGDEPGCAAALAAAAELAPGFDAHWRGEYEKTRAAV